MDSKLQELKRAWEASGSVEDEAAYLRERVRVGDLTQERLELAAYCGHEGASTVCGGSVPPADIEEWARGLSDFTVDATIEFGEQLAEYIRSVLDLEFPNVAAIRNRYRQELLEHAVAQEAAFPDEIPPPPPPFEDPIYRIANALHDLRRAEGPFIASIRACRLVSRGSELFPSVASIRDAFQTTKRHLCVWALASNQS